MKKITLAEYNAKPRSSIGVWDTERDDLPNWEADRHKYMGKRTMLDYDPQHGTVLLIEGLGFQIVADKKSRNQAVQQATQAGADTLIMADGQIGS